MLAYDAAFAGQAALLAVDRMTDQAVNDGWLRRPFAISAGTGLDYWFVTSTARRMPRKVALFRDWLLAEILA
jgi:DNA-binding transcriptional LysR family regulator